MNRNKQLMTKMVRDIVKNKIHMRRYSLYLLIFKIKKYIHTSNYQYLYNVQKYLYDLMDSDNPYDAVYLANSWVQLAINIYNIRDLENDF